MYLATSVTFNSRAWCGIRSGASERRRVVERRARGTVGDKRFGVAADLTQILGDCFAHWRALIDGFHLIGRGCADQVERGADAWRGRHSRVTAAKVGAECATNKKQTCM